MSSIEIICLEEPAFFELLERTYQRLKADQNNRPDKYISTEEAMKLLRINSKTTLQKYRDEGNIAYVQINPRVILYDIESIYEFLGNHTKETF